MSLGRKATSLGSGADGLLAAVAAALVATPALGVSVWRSLPPAPEARQEVAAAAIRGRIAVVGGLATGFRASARVDAYDPKDRSWGRLPDLPLALHHPIVASDGRRLFVAGGYAASGSLTGATRRAFVLAAEGRWRELPKMPSPRAAGGAAVVGGKLYVVGGTKDVSGDVARRSFVYDTRRRHWRVFPSLPVPREHLGVAALQGRIYALGGRNRGHPVLPTVDVYDPRKGRWRSLPPMPTARGGTSASAVAGLVVSVGGEIKGHTFRNVEAFDPRRKEWRRLPPLPAGRHGLGVAGLGGNLYAMLGGPRPGLSVSDRGFVLRVER